MMIMMRVDNRKRRVWVVSCRLNWPNWLTMASLNSHVKGKFSWDEIKYFFFLSQFLGNFFLFNFLTLAIFTLVSFKSNGKIQLWEGKIILLNYFHTLCWAIKHLENEFCENEFDEIERKILLIILVIFFCFKLWQSETSNFFFIPSEKSCQQFCCNFA